VAVFAAMKPSELGAFHKQEPNKLNFIKKLMNKKNKFQVKVATVIQ